MTDLVIANLQTRVPGMSDTKLSALSVTLKGGEISGLSGPSGSGKSLLLRAIADLDPAVGEIMLGNDSRSAMSASTWRSKVAYVPTESGWWHDSVGEHFIAADSELTRLLEKLGFEPDVLDWKVARVSSGERQRLALARCLNRSPQALLLDEPTASLGESHTLKLEQIVQEFCTDNSAPVFWVSHDQAQLNRIASMTVAIQTDGSIEVPVI